MVAEVRPRIDDQWLTAVITRDALDSWDCRPHDPPPPATDPVTPALQCPQGFRPTFTHYEAVRRIHCAAISFGRTRVVFSSNPSFNPC